MNSFTKKAIASVLALASIGSLSPAQDSSSTAPHPHKRTTAKKTLTHARQVRAVLAPTDFPIRLTAFDRLAGGANASGTVLEISKNGYKSTKPSPMFTKELDGEQISSVVSWQNPERTHFGFLVLTTPSDGNLYSVMFFLYHDGKLTVPIDEVANGYPVFPTVRKTASGQIQIQFNDGNEVATNDEIVTHVSYTWSDPSKKFMRSVHRVAAASAERPRTRRVERTQAALSGEGN